MVADLDRRFGGVARLYGEQGAARLRAAHVCVIGIGGVGSWVAEALARTGIGQIDGCGSFQNRKRVGRIPSIP